MEGFHEADSRGLDGFVDPQSLFTGTGGGFFGEDVFPGSECPQIPWPMQSVGKRVINDLHVWIINHVLVGLVDTAYSVFGSEFFGPAPVPRRHGD